MTIIFVESIQKAYSFKESYYNNKINVFKIWATLLHIVCTKLVGHAHSALAARDTVGPLAPRWHLNCPRFSTTPNNGLHLSEGIYLYRQRCTPPQLYPRLCPTLWRVRFCTCERRHLQRARRGAATIFDDRTFTFFNLFFPFYFKPTHWSACNLSEAYLLVATATVFLWTW